MNGTAGIASEQTTAPASAEQIQTQQNKTVDSSQQSQQSLPLHQHALLNGAAAAESNSNGSTARKADTTGMMQITLAIVSTNDLHKRSPDICVLTLQAYA